MPLKTIKRQSKGMKFTKMHGIGNDYVYVNAMQERVADPGSLAVRISDRHFGVGSDGLVLIDRSGVADFRMRMFNADGTEAEMCGNAARCVGKYVYDKGLTNLSCFQLETGAGIKTIHVYPGLSGVEQVRVDMGLPVLEQEGLEQSLHIGNDAYAYTSVSMGNPHAVLFATEIDSLDLPLLGPEFEHHSAFPNRTNTEFVEIRSESEAYMRVWERGAGETLACGTGACAVVVAGVLRGYLQRSVRVQLRGGALDIEWVAETGHVWMTGPAQTVFEGEWVLR